MLTDHLLQSTLGRDRDSHAFLHIGNPRSYESDMKEPVTRAQEILIPKTVARRNMRTGSVRKCIRAFKAEQLTSAQGAHESLDVLLNLRQPGGFVQSCPRNWTPRVNSPVYNAKPSATKVHDCKDRVSYCCSVSQTSMSYSCKTY